MSTATSFLLVAGVLWAALVSISPFVASFLSAASMPFRRTVLDWVLLGAPPLVGAFCLVALRPLAPETGDTVAYVRTFLIVGRSSDAHAAGESYFGNSEFLFWRLQSWLIPEGDARLFVVLNFIAVVLLTALCYRQLTRHWSRDAWLIFILVFLTYFTVYSGNGMRQALAIPLSIMAARYFWERRILRGVGLLVLAAGLHWAGVAVVGVLFLRFLPLARWVMLGVPAAALVLSDRLSPIVLKYLEGTSLSERAELYRAGVETTANPWTSLNLWVVVALYVIFVMARRPSPDAGESFVQAASLYFMSLVALTVSLDEVWVRFMVNLMFLTPIMAVAALRESKVSPRLASVMLAWGFLGLFVAWLYSGSAQSTLGYTF